MSRITHSEHIAKYGAVISLGGLESGTLIETGIAALLFAATFLAGNRVHPLRSLIRDRRSIVSFGSGTSAACVFVHVMPELHGLRRSLVEYVSVPLRYDGLAVYFVALISFLTFYGLEHRRARLQPIAEAGQGKRSFKLHVGGFAVYVALMAYLLVHTLRRPWCRLSCTPLPSTFIFS